MLAHRLRMLAPLVLAAASPAGGQTVDHNFRAPPLNAVGVSSLGDLRGAPVLIGYWGRESDDCVAAAVPGLLRMQASHGSDLHVILVESIGTPDELWQAFAWRRGWMDGRAMWTSEPPLEGLGVGLPEVALLGVDGSIVLRGRFLELGGRLDAAVAAEVQKARGAPPGTPKELERAWQLFRKGDLAAAFAECDRAAKGPAGEAAEAARAAIYGRSMAQIQRAEWLLDHGHVAAAETLLAALEKQARADPDLAAAHAEQKSRLGTPEIAREREADKAIQPLLAKLARNKPFEPGNVRKVQALAEKHAGTGAGERAARFVELSKVPIGP